MESVIAALTASQISRFFSANGPERIIEQPAIPAPVQGGTNYTVIAGEYVVQFRAPNAVLNLEFLGHVEKAYHCFMPCHSDSGTFGELFVYKMRNVGGVSLYLARDSLYRNGCFLLQQTVMDFTRFFASAWQKTPKAIPVSDRRLLHCKYMTQHSQLSAGLPERFRPMLNRLLPRLQYITAVEWPLVPNHIDLLENNIHVDPSTGKLTGVCDWAGTEVSPFGMSLGAVENMLGIPKLDRESGRTDHVYHANHRELSDLFYDELYSAMGSVSDRDKECIEDAILVGLFLTNAWRYDGAGNQLPAGEEEHGLQHLDAVLRATSDGY
ncbi:uncharacterized protein B0T15DRAFT_486588 [Chaetomium strumarium]|uniref:Aminoglycoside phosphotransferase domain-containing protein n=1 Tax=Chaetomium strumarium TaxID=1170767 RepID=A0AAJ0GN64_9PEZI|nr:hypothetical protein B0T15DRAFT_486588 [Chaetomium strumarium]